MIVGTFTFLKAYVLSLLKICYVRYDLLSLLMVFRL